MGKQHANLLPHYGEVFLYDDFLDASKADEFFLTLLSGISWQQHPVKMFGREVMQPRLTFSFADPGIVYGYSGLTLTSTPWSAPVTVLRTLVQEKTGHVFNTALLNLFVTSLIHLPLRVLAGHALRRTLRGFVRWRSGMKGSRRPLTCSGGSR